jgi:hypothetical protein
MSNTVNPTVANLTQPPSQPDTSQQKFWVKDTNISILTKKIQEQFVLDNQKKVSTGDEDAAHTQQYVSDTIDISANIPVNQRLRFNLIRHRNSANSATTLELFKSFVTALRKSDQFLAILPFQASKQEI